MQVWTWLTQTRYKPIFRRKPILDHIQSSYDLFYSPFHVKGRTKFDQPQTINRIVIEEGIGMWLETEKRKGIWMSIWKCREKHFFVSASFQSKYFSSKNIFFPIDKLFHSWPSILLLTFSYTNRDVRHILNTSKIFQKRSSTCESSYTIEVKTSAEKEITDIKEAVIHVQVFHSSLKI